MGYQYRNIIVDAKKYKWCAHSRNCDGDGGVKVRIVNEYLTPLFDDPVNLDQVKPSDVEKIIRKVNLKQ
jgi:hypothetical protein